jgi:protein-tyrosine-phosphatase
MIHVLFVCQANAVRSQMAEGWLRQVGEGLFEVRSAGLVPGTVSSTAIATMEKAGIDISGQASTQITPAHLEWADYIITLSDAVIPFVRPVPPDTVHLHWPIPNPDGLPEAHVNKERAYEQVSTIIGKKVKKFAESLKAGKAKG